MSGLTGLLTRAMCRTFGHPRPKVGWWGDGLYGAVSGGAVDGVGRVHACIMLECDRCGKKYVAARFHANSSEVAALIARTPATGGKP